MKINVLDKGFVEYIDHMGSDSRIVEAARVSYNGHSKGEEQDRKLLGYLYRNHHCYHPDMEVLTVEGWKKWRECSDEEVFAVPNSDSKTLTFEKLQVLKFPVVDEEMLSFHNSRMSFCVTNNHKMWFKGKYQDSFSLVDAGSMNKWGHFDRGSNYSVPNVGSDKFFELIGFYLGDGFLYSKNIISFRLCKSRKVEYLRNLLGSLNVPYSLDKYGVTSSGSEIFQYKFLVKDVPDIEKYIDLSKTAKYKSIDIKVLTDSQKAGLLAGMINSDGSIATGRKQTQFSSSSPDLCNVFMSISSLFGFDCHRVQSKDGCYSCIIYPNSSRISLEARKHYFSSIKYSGEVFCTTTSTNLLLVRGDSSKFSFVCGNSSPFEMCKITFKIKMPLFVAAQFNRHRMQNLNYVSFRYTEPEEDFYIPTTWRKQSTNNKQVSDVVEDWEPKCKFHENDEQVYIGHESVSFVFRSKCKDMLNFYKSLVASGVGREMARMILPQNLYTTCYSCWDLNNLIKFLKLRDHSHAQWEIQEYARAMKEVAKQHFPWTMELVQ
jgi:flavin-dependent thymidylate synthase